MAKGAGGKKIRVASPMLTKNGKARLGPLNLEQLKTMLEKSSKTKDKAKIVNRIKEMESRKVEA